MDQLIISFPFLQPGSKTVIPHPGEPDSWEAGLSQRPLAEKSMTHPAVWLYRDIIELLRTSGRREWGYFYVRHREKL